MVHCRECGHMISETAGSCPKCGARQSGGSGGSKGGGEKDKTTAGILAILLGGVGAHKFYLGKTGRGILYLVFCWTFIPSIIGLIEGITYLTKTDAEFQDKYVK